MKYYIYVTVCAVICVGIVGYYMGWRPAVVSTNYFTSTNDAATPATELAEDEVQADKDKIEPVLPSDFIPYKSEAGFSVYYPSTWKSYGKSGEDASLGSITVTSPGTVLSASSLKYSTLGPGDVIEQMVVLSAGAALRTFTFEDLKKYYRDKMQKDIPQITKKIIKESDIVVDGVQAYQIEYIKDDTYAQKTTHNILVVMLANTRGYETTMAASYGVVVVMEYSASSNAFNYKTFEDILYSFEEKIVSKLDAIIQEKQKDM